MNTSPLSQMAKSTRTAERYQPNRPAGLMNQPPAKSVWTRLAFATGAGALAALCSYPWWHDVSPWSGVAFAVTAAAIADMVRVSLATVPFPHVAVLICALQYGLAPWASCYYPSDGEYQIASFERYFAYAGPALLAIALGWTISALGVLERAKSPRVSNKGPALQRELDWLLWGGVALGFLGSRLEGGSLGFVVVLLANLRYVGGIGWFILAQPGWKWRLTTVLACEVAIASGSGMFHGLILWGLSILGVYVFMRRLKGTVLIPWLTVLAACVFVLQDAKYAIRQAVWYGNQVTVFGQPVPSSSWTKPFASALCFVESATKVFTGGYSQDSIADSVVRFNQGWIIDGVLSHVPAAEPYAHGETIYRALQASFLPRVLAPNKLKAGGKENMERFAGHPLGEGTSMNIGFAGEMYANFGFWGGLVGCGIYSLILGLLFRWVSVRAQTSALWWAIAAYAGHWALKAETDVGSVLNYVVKASVIMVLMVFFLPALRAELKGQVFESEQRSPRRERRRLKKPRSEAASTPLPVPPPATPDF